MAYQAPYFDYLTLLNKLNTTKSNANEQLYTYLTANQHQHHQSKKMHANNDQLSFDSMKQIKGSRQMMKNNAKKDLGKSIHRSHVNYSHEINSQQMSQLKYSALLGSLQGKYHDANQILKLTEDKIFQEIIQLILQNCSLEQRIEEESQIIRDYQQKKHHKYDKFHPDSTCQFAINKVYKDITIKQEDLKALSRQNEQLEQKVGILAIANSFVSQHSIQDLFQQQISNKKQLDIKRVELEQQIKQLKNQVIDPIKVRLEMENLSRELAALKEKNSKISIQKQINLQLEQLIQSQFKSKQLVTVLKKRLEMEEFIRNEEKNKEEFYKELINFKAQYNKVKRSNEELKSKIKNNQKLKLSFVNQMKVLEHSK